MLRKGGVIMAHGKFEFKGTGLGYLWLFIWTTFLLIITLGIFYPWAVTARKRWIVHIPISMANNYVLKAQA